MLMRIKDMMKSEDRIMLVGNLSEEQRKVLLEIFKDVSISLKKEKPLLVKSSGQGFLEAIDISPSNGDRIDGISVDNFLSPGEVKYMWNPEPCVVIEKAEKEGEAFKTLTIYLRPKQKTDLGSHPESRI